LRCSLTKFRPCVNLRKFRFSRDEPSPGLGVSYNEGDKRILMVIFFSLFLNLIRSSFHMQMRSAETFGRSIPATFYKKPSAVRHPGGRRVRLFPSIHHLILFLHYTLIFNELDTSYYGWLRREDVSGSSWGWYIRATDLYKSHIIF
jgi:hypothetical protein